MNRSHSVWPIVLRSLSVFTALGAAVQADVNLDWRPVNQTTTVGQVVEIGLFAVSDTTSTQFMASVAVILAWNANRLELIGFNPENDGYAWARSSFPDDRELDGLNDDCADGQYCDPYGGAPINDGDAYYEAWARFSPEPPAGAVPPPGLLVTKFRFRALRAGIARVQFVPMFGTFTQTRVMSGLEPGHEITGTLGLPVEVTIMSCALVPSAEADGSRYLAVTPAPSARPVALQIRGDPGDRSVACVLGYLQPDGRIGEERVFQNPSNWGTVHVFGEEIRPGSTYVVRSDCGIDGAADLSAPMPVTTWRYGDVNGNGSSAGDDLLLVLDASRGIFEGVTIFNVDLAGCLPDGQVDAADIIDVLDAFQGMPYSCPEVCTVTVDLDDFAEFLQCFEGPRVVSGPGCELADFNGDNYVDLHDFAAFQNAFLPVAGP